MIDIGVELLTRTRPRGALLWFRLMGERTDTNAPFIPVAVRGLLEESRPPWVR